MNTLSDLEIDFIYSDLQARGMTAEVLIYEMLDHICCTIEPELNQGISFHEAYTNLINSLEKDTFKKIQFQTNLSTNLKFQKMKKTMFGLGVMGALLLTAGAFLKSMHIIFGSLSLTLGGLIVVFGFLPLFFYTMYTEQVEKKNLWISIVGYLTASFLITGVLFRTMHWPGTYMIMLIGQILLIIVFLPLYLVNVFKKANEAKVNFAYILIIMGIGVGVIYMSSITSITKNILDKYDSIQQNSTRISMMFEATNDSLLTQLKVNDSTAQYSAIIEKINGQSQELYTLIDNLRLEMIKTANDASATLDNFGSKDNKRAAGQIMQRDGNQDKLKVLFNNYREYLITLTPKEEIRQVVNAHMDFDLYTGNSYEQGFRNTSMIEAVAMLSEMQKNARIAEYTILSAMK